MRVIVIARHILCLFFIVWSLIEPDTINSALKLPESDLYWKNLTLDHKKTAVFCIFKDSRDIVWLGTNSGLYFYDGVTTHPVGKTELFGTQVFSIVEKNDTLYIGSNNGLLTYDYTSGVVTENIIDSPKEIRTLLLVDDDIWIGGLNGIYKYNINKNEIKDYSIGLPHKSVYSLLRDSRGILYAGTYRGLARWDSCENRFNVVELKTGNSKRETSPFVNCLLEGADKESILIGGEGFLYRYIPVNERCEKIELANKSNVKSLCRGGDGHILIGTDDGLLDMSETGTSNYRHDSSQDISLADNEIWCVYSDSDNNIWTGHERGFSIASNSSMIRTIKLSVLTHSGEGNEIHSILRDSRGNLWFGGTNGVIRLSDDHSPDWYRNMESSKSVSHNRIRSIYEDMDQNIWLATDAGLNRLDTVADKFDVFHVVDRHGEYGTNWVYAIAEDNSHFWIGGFLNGIHYVKKSRFNSQDRVIVSDWSINAENKSLGLANNLVNDIIRDKEGDVWILLFRDNSLTRFSPLSRKFVKYDIFDLTGGYPTNICADNQGRIWCAFKGGVIVFTKGGKHRVVRFPHTNSDETVLALGKVGDGMWISTQSNVWNVDGKTFKANLLPIPQKSYTAVYDDVQSGKVYLGGADEILEVDNDIAANAIDYKNIRMVLNDRGQGQLNLSEIKGDSHGMTIPYGGSITLVVSSLDYSPESVQRYMYKLAASPSDTLGGWIIMPEGANIITFSDLKMGDYSVLVKAVGSPLAPVAVSLTVESPLALSWWAIMVYILIAVGIIYWIVWYMRKKGSRILQEQERQSALENVERKLSFLSTISHDLKTPLSMILGPVSLMKEKTKDPESRKNLETVYDNAVRLNNMIHRTLELQHIEDVNENLLILSIFDVVEFCKGVFENFKENNPQKNFIFHSSTPQILIEADAVKFESVITNLLSNACKYSEGNATVSFGISRQDKCVEIVVSDDGVGISDIDQPLVFQRMFRAPSISKLKEGTGLGLYLIKKYLELMNGNISLYSKEGQGTSFIVTLPITEKVLPRNISNSSSAENCKPKILIVEDNLQIAGFIIDILKDRYNCLTSENGRSGIAIASSFIPDLIIVDEMMPIMSGLEMVRLLKQNPRLAFIPIIMLTAKSDNKTENESIKLGIDIFMPKPFEPTALLGRISQLLKSRTEIKEKVRIQTITEGIAKPIEAESANEKALAKIARIIEENISDPDLNVNLLCEKSDMAQKQLYRLIKKYMGIAPLDYIRRVRLQKAAVLLSQNRFTVSEISYMVGFKTPSYFAKCFQAQFGVNPSQYRSDDEA